MLMKVRPELEPLQRLRAAVPKTLHQVLELMVGSVVLPIDQPSCAYAIHTLSHCLAVYGERIRFTRPEFKGWIIDAKRIEQFVIQHQAEIEGQPPACQLDGRKTLYPVWHLLLSIRDEQVPLQVALGGEIALAMLEQRQLNVAFCKQLRRDLKRYGRPQHGKEPAIDDLAELGFGRGWLARFTRIDARVRRLVEVPDPDGPARPNHAKPASRSDLLARLKWRFEYPNPKHRQGCLDDSHLTVHQHRQVCSDVRLRCENGDGAAFIQAISLIDGLTADLTQSLPLVHSGSPLHVLGIDVTRGCISLNLRALFPNGRRPAPSTARLFRPSDDVLSIALPVFLADGLRLFPQRVPAAELLGDLLGWPMVDSRKNVLNTEHCKLGSSLARAAKTTGPVAIMKGINRLVAACLSLDFSLIGSARMYYARLTGKEIHQGCEQLYDALGWGNPAMAAGQLQALGSHSVLTEAGVIEVFGHMAQQYRDLEPGPRSGVPALLAHHAAFTRYCVALIAFSLGLRQVHAYRLLSQDLMDGQHTVTIHDKQGGDRLMAQPARLNPVIVEQIDKFIQHARALLSRLRRSGDSSTARFAAALEKALSGQGPLFLFRSPRGAVRPAGSYNSWGTLPLDLQVPANCGRHFWQNTFREHGLSSRDIDRWMRHRVVGTENNTSSQISSPAQSFERLSAIQVRVLTELGIVALSGLKKA